MQGGEMQGGEDSLNLRIMTTASTSRQISEIPQIPSCEFFHT
jgi:hypothetical protein